MVAVNVRYVVERFNSNGSVRRYWVRPGYDTVRLPEENDRPAALLSTASVVARLRNAALTGDGAAAAQLARLAADVPAAHPDNFMAGNAMP